MTEQAARYDGSSAPKDPQIRDSDSYPEVIPKQDQQSYIYAVTQPQEPLYKANDYTQGEHYAPPPQRKWTRWPILLLCSIIIALAAGLIGGFIGKAIEGSHHQGPQTQSSQQNSQSNSTCTTTGSGSNSINATTLNIPIPTTGCPDINGQKITSPNTKATYQIHCSTGWTDDDVMDVRALTPSDCIEACQSYNKFSNGTRCIGGGFIPTWINETVAMSYIGGPFNCFLKSATSRQGRNDRPFEVVSVCFEGECKGAM